MDVDVPEMFGNYPEYHMKFGETDDQPWDCAVPYISDKPIYSNPPTRFSKMNRVFAIYFVEFCWIGCYFSTGD